MAETPKDFRLLMKATTGRLTPKKGQSVVALQIQSIQPQWNPSAAVPVTHQFALTCEDALALATQLRITAERIQAESK